MKKLLTILHSLTIAMVGGSSVISCVAPQTASGQPGERVILSTGGGQVTDRSFNEDAFDGLKNYLQTSYQIDGSKNYVEAQDSSYTSLVSGYRLAAIKKADALLLSGFSHLIALDEATKIFKNKSIVLIDTKPDYSKPTNKNVIGIEFNSQIAGMQAAFDAAYWATTKDPQNPDKLLGDTNGDNKITIGAFGGVSAKYATDNYLWGLFLGMELFNQWYQKSDEPWRHVYLANNFSHNVKDLSINSTADSFYYTGSFELGGAIKSGMLNRLVDTNKADIIFPVAGAQSVDVVNYVPKNGGQRPYIIGVDVNQSISYDKAIRPRFITSAIKNIHEATIQALKHASSLKDKKNGVLVDREPSQTWDGSSPTPFINWSVSLLDSKNSNNEWNNDYQLKTHKLKVYEGENGNVNAGSRIPNNNDFLVNYVNQRFKETSSTISSYMNGQLLSEIASEIIKQTPNLVYDNEN